MKALVFAKEKELALALMKVAELTNQLDQLRGSSCSNSDESTARHQHTRPASTGSMHDHYHHRQHQRVVVKPTTAPPPPPVAAAAVLSPVGDKVTNTVSGLNPSDIIPQVDICRFDQ